VSGKVALLAIDAGRRLVQLNIKPSFSKLESWINALEGREEEPKQEFNRRAGDRRAQA